MESHLFHYQTDVSLALTITIGVAQYQEDMSFDDCLARADRALYEGKQAGRNRVIVDVTSSTRKTGAILPANA